MFTVTACGDLVCYDITHTIYLSLSLSLYIYIYSMYTFTNICIYIYIYIYIYTYICIHTCYNSPRTRTANATFYPARSWGNSNATTRNPTLRGWNSRVHSRKVPPEWFESTHLRRDNLSREIGRGL